MLIRSNHGDDTGDDTGNVTMHAKGHTSMSEQDTLNAQPDAMDNADDPNTAHEGMPQVGGEGGKGGSQTMGRRIGDATHDERRKLGGIGGEGGIGSQSGKKGESADETTGHTASEAGWPG